MQDQWNSNDNELLSYIKNVKRLDNNNLFWSILVIALTSLTQIIIGGVACVKWITGIRRLSY